MTRDPFARIGGDGGKPPKKGKAWAIVMPVPADAPPPTGAEGRSARRWSWAMCCASTRRMAEKNFVEKAADAATRLLPGFVVVASPNGAKSAAKADWTPLRGRDVIIWPDADAAGLEYAQTVVKYLGAAGVRKR
jgi:hypothetical protein